MRLDINNAASILIDYNPYPKQQLKVSFGTNIISIRDAFGRVCNNIAYTSVTNGLTNAPFVSMAALKQWVYDHIYTNDDAASAFVAITKSDTVNIAAGITRGIYVGTAGDVVAVDKDSNAITFKNVPAGSILPVRAIRVNNTNTTAADLVALL